MLDGVQMEAKATKTVSENIQAEPLTGMGCSPVGLHHNRRHPDKAHSLYFNSFNDIQRLDERGWFKKPPIAF